MPDFEDLARAPHGWRDACGLEEMRWGRCGDFGVRGDFRGCPSYLCAGGSSGLEEILVEWSRLGFFT